MNASRLGLERRFEASKVSIRPSLLTNQREAEIPTGDQVLSRFNLVAIRIRTAQLASPHSKCPLANETGWRLLLKTRHFASGTASIRFGSLRVPLANFGSKTGVLLEFGPEFRATVTFKISNDQVSKRKECRLAKLMSSLFRLSSPWLRLTFPCEKQLRPFIIFTNRPKDELLRKSTEGSKASTGRRWI